MSKRRLKPNADPRDSREDPPMSRLFIVCSKNNTEEDFRNAFQKFGRIEEIRILKDRDGSSKGVVYVKFSKTSEAALACESMNGEVIGDSPRPIKVLIAASRQLGSASSKNREDEKAQRLFIITPKEFTEDILYEQFSKYGPIDDVTIVRDRKTRDGKQFAYIKFLKFSSAALAFENCDEKYKAVFAEPKPFRSPSQESGSNFTLDDRNDRHSASLNLLLSAAPLNELSGSNDCVLHVICGPMVTHDQLWRLFDIVPNLDFCKMNNELEVSNSATVVYKTPQAALHARQKLHGFEYPPGERLIVKLSSELKNFPLLEGPSQMLVENNVSTNFCSVNLPPVQPFSKETYCAQRCFIVCSPHVLPIHILKQVFCRFGNLIDVYLLNNRNCGYVKYATVESAKQANLLFNAEKEENYGNPLYSPEASKVLKIEWKMKKGIYDSSLYFESVQSINVNSKHALHTNKRFYSNGMALLPDTDTTLDQEEDDEDDDDDAKSESDYSNEYDQGSSGIDIFGHPDDFDRNNALPFFHKVPENAYIMKNRQAILKCKATNALDLVFQCVNDTKTNPPTKQESHVNPQSGVRTLEATAEISLAYFEQFFVTPFQCECIARNSGGEVKSRPATIVLAHLEKNFILSPPSARIEPGSPLEIKCTLPNALPPAVRSWLKNNQKIEQSSSITITQDGSLIIHSAKVQDSGNYSCVAKNIVGKRVSYPVPVIVRSEKRWSEWSSCNSDCLKFRHRNCNSRSPDDCQGKEVETAECRDGSCEEKINSDNSDRVIYFSLIIVSVLCVVLAALFAHSKRKKPEIPDYIVTDNEILEIQTKNYEGEKRYRQQLQPMKKSSYTYEYNTMAPDHYIPPPTFPKTIPANFHHENHYHEPQLAITYSVPFDKISSKISNSNTSSTRKLQSDTISSSTESLNSTQVIEMESSSTTSLMNDKNPPKSNMIEQMVTSNGGWLELEHLETSLSIPELTFERTRKYNIFLTVLHNEFIKNQITCNFNDNSTHLSSIIYCGPSDVLLNKPVILKFPHCANHYENWTISLLHNNCANDSQKAYIDMDDEKDKWKRIASTNNDVINPLAFIQLDSKNAFIISRVLGKLLLVGESKSPEIAVEKRMKIALFGPKHKMPAGDFNVRIYIVEDYRSSIDYCTIIEKNLGNDLLMLSKDFLFKNNKEDLWVQLVCSGGWVTRNESQKIPYSHLWKNSYLLHCDFLLEKSNYNVNKLNMEIFVKQKHGDDIFLNNLLLYT
ncbi:CLUMA_CG015370, isoform A [Clunio marinus]|uniref:Netrin receptor UNC5 n=1 Tax=Clunio marinus TaxID=568069 RepID=A0A1J1IT61_9DIPT|nr:CLUMA_CG015370, isoform A [Clunio marinus]